MVGFRRLLGWMPEGEWVCEWVPAGADSNLRRWIGWHTNRAAKLQLRRHEEGRNVANKLFAEMASRCCWELSLAPLCSTSVCFLLSFTLTASRSIASSSQPRSPSLEHLVATVSQQEIC